MLASAKGVDAVVLVAFIIGWSLWAGFTIGRTKSGKKVKTQMKNKERQWVWLLIGAGGLISIATFANLWIEMP